MPIQKATARRIRLVILDVDGVLTNGGLYIGATQDGQGVELKSFHVEDGLGIKLIMKAGIRVAIVSGRISAATRLRAAELGIADVHQDGHGHKLPVVKKLLASGKLDWSQVAVVGDDLADLPLLRRAGLPATVANGVPEVCHVAVWQSRRAGGSGAVREFAKALLSARGDWTRLVDEYCQERGG